MMSQEEILIQSYVNELKKCKTKFYEQASVINDKFASRISNPLVEDLYQLKGVELPDEEFIVELESAMDLIIAEYASSVKGNVTIQEQQAKNIYQGMETNKIKPIKYKEFDMDERLPEIVKEIIKKILVYFKTINESKKNSMYWQRKEEVKKLVKKIVTLKRVGKTIIELESLYNEILNEMEILQNEFVDNYLEYENNDEKGNEKVR